MSAELLKIPQELYDLAIDKVITNKEEHKITNRVTAKVVSSKVPHPTIPNRTITKSEKIWVDNLSHSFSNGVFGIGLLNMIAFYTLDYGYSYDGKDGDAFIFVKGDGTKMRLDIGDKFTMTIDNGIRSKTFTTSMRTNGVTTTLESTYSAAQIAERLGSPEGEVIKWLNGLGWVWNGVKVDTNTHVANIFSTLDVDNGVAFADVLVNGKSFTEYNFGSLTFPFGKSGQDFVVDWVLYNEHQIGESVDWLSEGNFGEAGTVRISSKSDPRATAVNIVSGTNVGYDADTHTFTYDPTKQAILSFQSQLKPAQGKNDVYEVCLDLNTGETYLSRIESLKNAKGLEG
jgi:hypothetical protein